jgi:hypothetical protein
MEQKQYEKGDQLFRQALQVFAETLPLNSQNEGIARSKLGRSLLYQHRFAEAEKESHAGYEILSKQENPSKARLHDVSTDLVEEYEALRQAEPATRFRAEVAELDEKTSAMTSRK